MVSACLMPTCEYLDDDGNSMTALVDKGISRLAGRRIMLGSGTTRCKYSPLFCCLVHW